MPVCKVKVIYFPYIYNALNALTRQTIKFTKFHRRFCSSVVQ